MKRCKKCGETKALNAFNRCKHTRDGHEGSCRACRAKNRRDWYENRGGREWASSTDTSRAWRTKNPDRWRELQRVQNWRRREARRAMKSDIAVRDFVSVLRADPCVYCGASCEHIDHIEPHVKGHPTTWDNLTASCARCNRMKWRTPLLTFLLKCATN